MYKLIVIDIDDTLLNDDRIITERTIEAIRKAVEKNVIVTLATGRMFAGAAPIAEKIGVSIPIICYQGSLIRDLSNQVLYEKAIPTSTVKRIIEFSKDHNIHLQLYSDDKLYVKEENDKVHTYSRMHQVQFHVDPEFESFAQNKGITKMVIYEEPEVIDSLYMQFKDNGEYYVTKSKPYFLEFLHPEVNKGAALKYLCEHLSIDLSEVIVIGDSWNDYEMMKIAGLPVAMGNAVKEIKNIAKYITFSNNNDGISDVITKFILQNKEVI